MFTQLQERQGEFLVSGVSRHYRSDSETSCSQKSVYNRLTPKGLFLLCLLWHYPTFGVSPDSSLGLRG